MYVYCKNKNIKNTFVSKQYFATFTSFSSYFKIETFQKVT